MRNKILKGITLIAALTAVVSGSMLDSVTYIPYVVLSICLAWLIPFTYVNREVIRRYE